jgi:hypothetical protein
MAEDGSGSKWSHEPFWPYLESIGFDVPKIRKDIDDAFATIIAASARSFKLQKNHRVSFELFGFDVLIDSEQNISVLEVNVSPAMGGSSELDLHVKQPLLKELFDLVLIPTQTKANLRTNKLMIADHTPASVPHKQFVSVCEYELALRNIGHFRCIFPTIGRCADLQAVFNCPSENDQALALWLTRSERDRHAFLQSHYDNFCAYISKKKHHEE